MNEETTELNRRIEELEKKIKVLEDHKHLGIDNSKELDDTTRIGCKEIRVSGVGIQRNLFAVPFFRAFDIDNMSKNARKIAIALGVTGEKDTTSEQDNMVLQVGKGESRGDSSRDDWENNSFSQIILTHRPKGIFPSIPLPAWGKNLPTSTFLTAKRSPIVFGKGVISGNKVIDVNANFNPAKSPTLGETKDVSNTIVHGICNAKNENFAIQEANRIIEVTKTEIICENEWQYQGEVNYEVVMPVVLGSANTPFSLGYFGDGLRFGYGNDIRNKMSSLSWGDGTPEGKIRASVGSMYLRQDGGTGTTLYIKEEGMRTNTGWVAK